MTTRIMAYDPNQGILSWFWNAGSFLGSFNYKLAASDRYELADKLNELILDPHEPIHLQLWSHGRPGAPVFGATGIRAADLLAGLGKLDNRSLVWFRSCDVFQGETGQSYAIDVTETVGCRAVGHTRIVSSPVPACQSGGYGLRPGETPHWSKSEAGGSWPWARNTCLVTAMTPPLGWWQ
jgi:hypothetical protein